MFAGEKIEFLIFNSIYHEINFVDLFEMNNFTS